MMDRPSRGGPGGRGRGEGTERRGMQKGLWRNEIR